MSTAPEVTVARQCGVRCFSIALVTNTCIMTDDNTTKDETDLANSSGVVPAAEKGPTHEEVLSAGLCQAENLRQFFHGLIAEFGTMQRNKTE